VATGLCSSASDARRAIAQGGVALNNVKVESDDATFAGAALAGGAAVLRRGKKTLAGVVLR
jgi:tyrosyl-tRNA synthetase